MSKRDARALCHGVLAIVQVAVLAVLGGGTGEDDGDLAYDLDAGHGRLVLARAVSVVESLSRRAPEGDRADYAAISDEIDGAEERPVWAACGRLRLARTAAAVADCLEAVEAAATRGARVAELVDAGCVALLLDVLAPSPKEHHHGGKYAPAHADAKPWCAMWALKACGGVAAASEAARSLLATRGAVARAVALAGSFDSTPGVRRAAVYCCAALLPPCAGSTLSELRGGQRAPAPGAVVDPADYDEDADAAARALVFETAEVVAAGALVALARDAACEGIGVDDFRSGVADWRTLTEDDGERGLACLCKLVALAARPNDPPRQTTTARDIRAAKSFTADRAARRAGEEREDRRAARRAAFRAANRMLRRRLARADVEGILGDYLSSALVCWHDRMGDVATTVLHSLASGGSPRTYWRGDADKGVEVAAWFAKHRETYGEVALQVLVDTVERGGFSEANEEPSEAAVRALVAVALESDVSLERVAPALETLFGAKADDVEHKEKLEGFGASFGVQLDPHNQKLWSS